MCLVFEGGDLVGKSTMVKATCAALNAAGMPHIPQHMSRLPACWNHYEDYVSRLTAFTVWDRFHMGEVVYRAHDDRKSGMTPTHYSLIDAALTALGGFVVVVIATDKVIRSRHASRDDDMYSLDHILKVNESYRLIADRREFESRGMMYRPRVDAVIAVDDPQMDITNVISRMVNSYVEHMDLTMEALGHGR